MNSVGWLVTAVRRHPWSSSQDAVVLTLVMLGGVLLAIEYDLVEFWEQYSDRQRRIRVEEVFLLSVLLAGGLALFIFRRFKEARLDIERQIGAEAARMLAMQDSLTGLPNRRALEAALDRAIGQPLKTGCSHAFYLLDLNGFKRVNDDHGHATGDELLRVVAKRFAAAARNEDLVARIGGDEFAVLALNVDGREKAINIGGRFVSALGADVAFGGRSYAIGVAVGVALYPEDGSTRDEIMHHADLAMYKAKAGRQSTVQLYQAA
jgi:diguanylate cyclase (GGDEF)-like protein